MMKRTVVSILLAASCQSLYAQKTPQGPAKTPPPPPSPQQMMKNRPPRPGMDRRFTGYKQMFIEAMWRQYPAWASSVGYHRYDSALVIPDARSRNAELEFCMHGLKALEQFPYDSLSDNNKTDYKLIENQLKYAMFNIQELKAYEWDPSQYNVSGGFADILGSNFNTPELRLRNLSVRLQKVPAYYAAAKASIKSPTAEHIQLAIEQNEGGISVFQKDLDDAVAASKLTAEEKTQIRERADKAIAAIKDYVGWLKTQKQGSRGFRLGKELYEKKFAFELQSGYTADQIYQKAVKHKDELHEEMYKLTEQLWTKYMKNAKMPKDRLKAIKDLIEVISQNHVKPQDFQSAIEKQLPELVAFVQKKKLLQIDTTKPLVVRKEPAYMAGVAGASVNAPGPYDKYGKTYYNVGSLEGWDSKKAESYLREYNHYILQILNIHEAIPGHYTQLVHANRSPSMVKSILGNNAMIEGWAVYAERMMLENGYDGDAKPGATEASPEMWLMYYKWNLRSTCNMILDYDVHTKNMSENEAMELLTRQAFQEEAEARAKWKRVSVTQVQLCCYFTGYTEIYDLREEIKALRKDNFSLYMFHEQFLSYGSAPVKYIRQLMLLPNGKADQ